MQLINGIVVWTGIPLSTPEASVSNTTLCCLTKLETTGQHWTKAGKDQTRGEKRRQKLPSEMLVKVWPWKINVGGQRVGRDSWKGGRDNHAVTPKREVRKTHYIERGLPAANIKVTCFPSHLVSCKRTELCLNIYPEIMKFDHQSIFQSSKQSNDLL